MENIRVSIGNGYHAFGNGAYSLTASGLRLTRQGLTGLWNQSCSLAAGGIAFGAEGLALTGRILTVFAKCSAYTIGGLALGIGVNLISGNGPNGNSPKRFNELNEVFITTGLAIGVFSQISKMLSTNAPSLNMPFTLLGYAALVGSAAISQFPNGVAYVKAVWHSRDLGSQQSASEGKSPSIGLANNIKIYEASAQALGILLVGVVAQMANYAICSK